MLLQDIVAAGDQRTCILFLSAHDTRGGTTNYIKTLRGRLERTGVPCRAIALYSAYFSDPSGFDEVLVPGRHPSLWAYARAIAKFVARVRRDSPAAILTVMPIANVAAGLAGWVSGSVAICTHHSPHDKNGRLVRVLDMIMGTLGAYRRIVCVSDAVAQTYARHPRPYRERITVVPNGVPSIMADAERAATIAKFGLSDQAPIVFMAGRLAPQKNVLTAVEAIANVEGVQLVLSGDGPLRDDLVALAARLGVGNRVHLLGQIDRQDLVNLMFHCDAFMQISMYEGQSMALLEAVYAGAPPIISDIPEQREVITVAPGTIAGIACDPCDPEHVAAAIKQILFDEVRRREVLANLAALAPSIRTEDRMLDDYERLLVETLDAKDAAAAGGPRQGS